MTKALIIVLLPLFLSSCAYLNPVKDKCVEIYGIAQVNIALGPASSSAHLPTPESYYRSAPPGVDCWWSLKEKEDDSS